MSPSFDHQDAKHVTTLLSAEDQEREAYLNEVTQRSTQFGCGSWDYQATYDFNDN